MDVKALKEDCRAVPSSIEGVKKLDVKALCDAKTA